MAKIFVSIASYKDPELLFTIDTLLAKAKNPCDLRIVVCQQDFPENFKTYDNLSVEFLNYNFIDSQGVCWARKQISDKYTGEEYFLQIDSHIAMAENWDDLMINQILMAREKGSKKIVFSTYPTPYTIENGERQFHTPYIPRTVLREDNVFYFHTGTGGGGNNFYEPIPSPYLNAGCMFGDGSFYIDCAYDSDIYFEGEELLNSLKAFTHGYDLYNPSVHLCWHLYKLWDDTNRESWELHHNERDDKLREVRHWDRNRAAREKLLQIFSGALPNELGNQRSIANYEEYIKRPILK